MKKVKLETKTPDKAIIEHNGAKIEVTSMLSLAEQILSINAYVDEYFYNPQHSLVHGTNTNLFEAEHALKSAIFQLATNIEVTSDMSSDIFADTILWDKVTAIILNYGDFKRKLDYIVKEIKEQEALRSSVGTVLAGLISKGYEVLENFKGTNPEEIKQATETIKSALEKLESSKAFPLMNESQKSPRA